MRASVCLTSAFLLFTAAAVPAAPAASSTDRDFVAKVSQGGEYEVQASKYALLHATGQDVKDLAAAEVHDHELVGAKLKRVSSAAGIQFGAALNPEFTDRLARLKDADAQSFDVVYLEDMKSIHDKDEKLFAQEAKDGSPGFKAFAAETDRIVKRHIGALHGLDQTEAAE